MDNTNKNLKGIVHHVQLKKGNSKAGNPYALLVFTLNNGAQLTQFLRDNDNFAVQDAIDQLEPQEPIISPDPNN